MIRTVFGSNKSGTALIPIFGTITMRLLISTRVGNSIVNKGDGSADIVYVTAKNTNASGITTTLDLTYSSAFTGNISVKFLFGLKDVYSIAFFEFTGGSNSNTDKQLNILDLKIFFGQFQNINNVYLDYSDFGYTKAILKGDLSQFPDSLESLSLRMLKFKNAGTDLYLNFSNYSASSKLKSLVSERGGDSTLKILGDLGKAPSTLQYLNIQGSLAGSTITYSAGKVWTNSFDTLYLPIPLTTSETDNLFIDANNSVTTAIGGKLWDLKGVRTPTSDVAVAGLIAKSFTVNCFRISDTMLTMPLSANLLDYSTYSNHATMVGTETHSLGGLVTSTGNYAYIPNKTSLDFGTGNLRFGCTVKFSAVTGTKGIIGKTYFGSIKGRYGITIDGGSIYGLSQMTAGNVINTVPIGTYNDGNFHTIEVICNRTTGNQTLTIDGVLINTTSFTPSSDNLALNQKFHIGAHGNTSGGIVASSELNGIIKDVFVNKF